METNRFPGQGNNQAQVFQGIENPKEYIVFSEKKTVVFLQTWNAKEQMEFHVPKNPT